MIAARTGFWRHTAALAAFCALVAAIFIYLLGIAGGVHLGGSYRLIAVVPNAEQLVVGANVREHGVDVGRVQSVSNRGATAVIELALDPAHAPVHLDGHVQIRAKTLVGENYVDLDPGTARSPAIPNGGTLPIAQARPSVQVDQILSTLDPTHRRELQRLLSGLAPGLADEQAVGAAVSGASELLSAGKRVVDPLAAERASLRSLIPNLAAVFAAFGQQQATVQDLVRSALSVSTSVAVEQTALRAVLRELSPTLDQVRHTASHLAAVGERAEPVLDDLTAALEALSPVVQEVPGAVGPTLDALDRLASAAPVARELLTQLRLLAGPAAQLVPALDDALRELRPALAYIDPYSRDVGAFFAAAGQALWTHDATSHLARLQLIFSPGALPILNRNELEALKELLGMGLARLVTLECCNPYPKPWTLATPTSFIGPYPRVQRDNSR